MLLTALKEWIHKQDAAMTTALRELAEINSGSRNLSGLRRAATWLVNYFSDLPAEFESVELPEREFVTDGGLVTTLPTGALLRWDYRPSAARRVLLGIHYDTVFGEDDPFQTCTDLGEDRLNGPGVADAKGGIIVMATALRALHATGGLDDIGWTVVLNPDEELGSPSSAGYLQQIAPEYDFALLFEPALPDGALVSQRKGSGNFTLVVRGRSAHAGRHFEEGRNAIVLLARLIDQIDRLNGQRPGTTINVGMISGGTALNVVPDLAVARINARFARAEDVDWFQQRLEAILQPAQEMDGFAVELHGAVLAPPKEISEPMRQLMQSIEQSVQACGGPPVQWCSTGGVCDGNRLAAAGLPNVDTLGPRGGGLHSSDEWVDLDSLPVKSAVVAHLLRRWDRREWELPPRTRQA